MTKIYIPIALMNEVLHKYNDWKMFGERLHTENIDGFLSEKQGFYEFNVDNDKLEDEVKEFKRKLGNCFYVKHVPVNY